MPTCYNYTLTSAKLWQVVEQNARVVWHGDRKLQFFDQLGFVLVDGKLKPVADLAAYLACLDIKCFNLCALVHLSIGSGGRRHVSVAGGTTGKARRRLGFVFYQFYHCIIDKKYH